MGRPAVLTSEQITWLQRNKAMSGGGPASVQPVAPPAGPDSSGLPRPMQADCKVVHNRVPGPENHLLCSTHGHIVDTQSRTIIALDLKDYLKRGLGGHHRGGRFAATHHTAVGTAPATPAHAAGPAGGTPAGAAPTAQTAHTPPAASRPAPTQPARDPSNGGSRAATPPATAAPAQPVAEQTAKEIDAVALQVMANQVVEYLHNHYNDLAEGVQATVNEWSVKIEKLKEAAPKEPGGLLSQLGSALASMTVLIFPELEVVKITMEVKEIADKGAEADQQKREAAEAKALFASKMAAKEALNRFAEEVRKEAKDSRAKLVTRVRTAVKDFAPPPDFNQQILKDMQNYTQEFAVKYLGIKIGDDYQPGAVAKVQQKLSSEIGHWLRQEYIEEHEAAQAGKDTLGFSSAYAQYLPPDVQKERLEAFFEDNPDFKIRIDKELADDYYDEFRKKVWGEKD
jgi:hypothetical protein